MNKIKGNIWIMLVFSLVSMISLFLVSWLSFSSFETNYGSIKRQSYAFVSGQIIDETETSLSNGKTMGSFYGMDRVLKRLVNLYDEKIGAIITDNEGTPLYNSLTDEEREAVYLHYSKLDFQDIEQSSVNESGFSYTRNGETEFLAQPIREQDGTNAGYLVMVYSKDNIDYDINETKTALYGLVGIISLVALVSIIIFTLLKPLLKAGKNEDEENRRSLFLTHALILSVAIVILSSFSYNQFQNKYKEVMFEGAKNISYYIWDMISTVGEKGVPYDQMHGLDAFLSQKAEETPILWNFRMYRVLADTSNILNRSDEFKFSLPFNNDSNLMIEIEISQNYINNKMLEMALIFIITLIISIIIVKEAFRFPSQLVFRLSNKFNSRCDEQYDNLKDFLRMSNFLFFLAIYATMPFSALMIREWNKSIFSLPIEITASLPMTIELFSSMAGALLLPRIVKKIPIKLMLFMGGGLIIGANILCVFSNDPITLISLRFVTGIGFAFKNLVANSIVSYGTKDGEDVSENYGALNAGTLAGITVGATLGSVIASAMGVRISFLFTAGLIIAYVLLVLVFVPWNLILNNMISFVLEVKPKAKGILKSYLNGNVLKYFVLIAAPVNFVLMFVVACLPSFIQNQGLNPLLLSYCFIFNGLAGIYIGTALIRISKKVKLKFALAIIPVFGGVSMLLLGIPPVLITTLAVSVLLGVFDGYSSGVYMTGFLALPEIKTIDEPSVLMTRMGAFGSGVQTISPVIYGGLMSAGNGYIGVWAIAIILIGAGILYLIAWGKPNIN